MPEPTKFEMHCIVEIFGHAQIAGKVSEQTIAGQGFIRVDVPKTSKREGFTRFYGPGAIYAMTPVDEKIAGLMAEKLEIEPVSEWTLQRAMQKLLADATTAPHPDLEDWDSSNEWPDDKDDTPFFGPEMPVESEPLDLHATPTSENVATALSQLDKDKRAAAQWARELLQGEFVILDIETTGLNEDRKDEPVQISIIDQNGMVLLDTLVKPSFSIPADATGIHGITDEMVKDAPPFGEIRDRLIDIFRGKPLVIYNADYDKQILLNAHASLDGLFAPAAASAHHCAMMQYAQFYGAWNDYHGNYRWQALGNACQQQSIQFFGTVHSAIGDCQATLALIKKMAEFETEKSVATE